MQNMEQSSNPSSSQESGKLDSEYVRIRILELAPEPMALLKEAFKEEEADITIEQACAADFFSQIDERHLQNIEVYRRELVMGATPESKKKAASDLVSYLLNM
jgi:hypothetical protein